MYEKLKSVIKQVLPDRILRNHEGFIRTVIAAFYRGKNYHCNICGFDMARFILLKSRNKICPKCGSLPRSRRLWMLLESVIIGKSILHFSPSGALRKKLESSSASCFVTTDYSGEFEATKELNIEEIDEPNDRYDLIICFHILEHISNDRKAMKELLRILKPGGMCFIQTPFKDGDIYENDAIITEKDRLDHFGQEDHVRMYSVEGLSGRLEEVGFKVAIKHFEEKEDNPFGLNENEFVLFARKPS